MWTNWNRRNLPVINYQESSSEDDAYVSPEKSPTEFRSPRRPLPSGSPINADPTSDCQTDRVLAEANYKLSTTPKYIPDPNRLTQSGEEVVVGQVAGGPVDDDNGAGDDGAGQGGAGGAGNGAGDEDDANNSNQGGDGDESGDAADMVNYDVEDKEDGDKAADLARAIRVEFDPNDICFWFAQLEDEMEVATIGRQWLKKTVLQRNLPVKQKEDVKGYLIKNKAEAGDHIYFDIKTDLIRIYAPKPSDSYRKALTRTMVGLPSQLGLQIVNDVCKKSKKLDGCCCSAAVLALWSLQLPVNVRAHISNETFDKDTYRRVFEAADQVFLSSKQVTVAAVARPVSMDETLPAFSEHNQPQVAAVKSQNNKNQGQGKGQKKNKNKKGQNGQGQSKPRGPRHASMPPESCCDRHYVHGDQAWYCLAPTTCPWVSRITPRAN